MSMMSRTLRTSALALACFAAFPAAHAAHVDPRLTAAPADADALIVFAPAEKNAVAARARCELQGASPRARRCAARALGCDAAGRARVARRERHRVSQLLDRERDRGAPAAVGDCGARARAATCCASNRTCAFRFRCPPARHAARRRPKRSRGALRRSTPRRSGPPASRGRASSSRARDTGYQWDHPALQPHYRGWDGATADHNYNWHDSIHDSTGNPCGNDSPEPCDDAGHGTHTAGTFAGDDGATHQTGVAPGAKWIGCRNMDGGDGTPARYIECMQWMLAPTDLAGLNPNPDLAPDVINNSWGCPVSEGCTVGDELEAAVDNVVAGGILFVASAANAGPACETILTPPATYDSSFVIGATDTQDRMASFSSRGPVVASDLIRPDLSAPGVNVLSSLPPNTYGTLSGTSMAAPHVTGTVALMLSVAPRIQGRSCAHQGSAAPRDDQGRRHRSVERWLRRSHDGRLAELSGRLRTHRCLLGRAIRSGAAQRHVRRRLRRCRARVAMRSSAAWRTRAQPAAIRKAKVRSS